MKFRAIIQSKKNQNKAIAGIDEITREIHLPVRSSGYGSSVSGGELLLLSLATCFCNDLYREADKKHIKISEVSVDVTGDFISEGEAGSNFQYQVEIKSDEPVEVIENLVIYTDRLAEIHKTLRKGVEITLSRE
jgi:uncharacterized OsmC-like protein